MTAIHVKNELKEVKLPVPFKAGSKVKDLYSGSIYNVNAGQTVTVALPSMSDGGTVILAAVPGSGGDNGTNPDAGGGVLNEPGSGNGSGAAGGNSPADPAVKSNPGQRFVNEESLRSGQEKVTIQLDAAEAEYQSVKPDAERVMALYKENVTTPDANDKAMYGLKQITAKYNHAKDQLEYTRLYAPFSGYVQKLFL